MSDKSLRFLLFGEDKGASGVFGALGVHANSVSGAISSSFGKMGHAIGGELGSLIGETADKFSELGEHASKGAKLLAGGAAITAIGTGLQFLGSAEQQATDQLKAAVDASGHSWEDYEGQVEGAIKTQEKFGHGAADTSTALRILTASTNDPAKALASMGDVANLAAAKHISLADAAALMARVMNGTGGKVLSTFGIQMAHTKDRTADAKAAMEELSKKLDGQAAASVDNFSGKVGIIKTQIGDWAAGVAQTLGPALTAIGPILMVTGTIMEIVTARKAAAAAAEAALTVATEAGTVATEEATVAQSGLNLAFLTSPVGLIVIGIAALIAIVVLAYNHVSWFKTGVDKAMHGITVAFGWITEKAGQVFSWLRDHWQLVLAIMTGPIGLAVLFITTHLDGIKSAFSTAVGFIKTVMGGVVGAITWPFRTAFNLVSSMWNRTIGSLTIQIPSWVPIVGGNSFSFPKLPGLFSGGTLTRGGMVRVGENGPENLVLPAAASVVPLSRSTAGGGAQIYITVDGDTDPVGAARKIYQTLKDAQGSGHLRLDWTA
jgi:hypothetical protein